ncbi:MAG: hypothetical protein GY898_30200 [Proteobacteria bacterium]|nr:hypothetical protein [Pseudomonadota bacterium]
MRRAFLLLICTVILAGADAPGSDVGAIIDEFNTHAWVKLPVLTAAQLEKLDDGKVIRERVIPEDPDHPQMIAGYYLIDRPRNIVWAGLRDPHLIGEDEVYEAQLSEHSYAPSQWYQSIELPWPFEPRQWVIDVVDNLDLAKATGNRCWEHVWRETPNQEQVAAAALATGKYPGMSQEVLDEAIWLDHNLGAWVIMEISPSRTLVVYHVATVLGGNISDKLVADYSALRMKKLMLEVEDAADKAAVHFVGAHAPVQGGDGAWVHPAN